MDLFGHSSAEFSPDRIYRYALYRSWDIYKPTVMFIGLNPSTADEVLDDPTVRRCRRFAINWGYGKMFMANLFALRATNPKTMMSHDTLISPKSDLRLNDIWIQRMAKKSDLVIAAWGNHGRYMDRDKAVLSFLSDVMCLGITKGGAPKHPLYLKADTRPRRLLIGYSPQ